MGRLQRKKKTSAKKKHKKNQANSELLPDSKTSVKSRPVFLKDALKDKKKILTQSVRKPQAIAKKSYDGGRIKRQIELGVQFLREVRVELKKVVWPTRVQVIGSTTVVIVLVLIVSFFLGVVDFGLQHLVRVILQ